MRLLLALSILTVAFAGCTQEDTPPEFDASCPSWKKSPGQPGARVDSFDNATGTDFNLAGTFVHKPTLIDEEAASGPEPMVIQKYEWDGALFDVVEFTPSGAAANGYYELRVWRADKHTPHESDGQKVTYDERNKKEQLGFRDYTGSGVQTVLQLRPDSEYNLEEKTYRIEFASIHEDPRPGDLWVEYKFIADDPNEDAAGRLQYDLSYWYRAC